MPRAFQNHRRLGLGCYGAFVLLVLAMAGQVQASPASFAFGTVQNYDYEGLGGFCVAASFMNGATYLHNAYPSVYGTSLATGPESTTAAAALDFAYNGWTSPKGTSFAGYYSRVTQNGANFGDWWQTTIDWTESYAPGKTAYSAQVAASLFGENPATWTLASDVANRAPTVSFLQSTAAGNDFVELCIYGYNIVNGNQLSIIGGHAIDLANITYSQGAYTLTYQDPNFPTSQFLSAQLSSIWINGQQFLTFDDTHTFGANVFIEAAFAESPLAVPEPGTLILTLIAAVAIGGYARRKAEAVG